jgi:hypothetical protein
MLATLFKNLRFKMVLVYPFLMGFHLLEKVHAVILPHRYALRIMALTSPWNLDLKKRQNS